jgi:hypothetical protein
LGFEKHHLACLSDQVRRLIERCLAGINDNLAIEKMGFQTLFGVWIVAYVMVMAHAQFFEKSLCFTNCPFLIVGSARSSVRELCLVMRLVLVLSPRPCQNYDRVLGLHRLGESD